MPTPILYRQPDPANHDRANYRPWFYTISVAAAAGFSGIVIYSWAEKSWSVFACAHLVGLAASQVGGLAGFIFGIPKTIATQGTTTEHQGNTNLEQISDWLTKILVGAGLVELKELPSALGAFGSTFRENNALGSLGWVVAPAIVITFSVCGFLLAYLWARIYMIAELEQRKARDADRARSDSTIVDARLPAVPHEPRVE